MMLRQSRFVHVLRLGEERVLVVHALTHLRLGVDPETERLIRWFDEPRDLPGAMPDLIGLMGHDAKTLAGVLASLLERGVLTDSSPEAELDAATARLNETHGRDGAEALAAYRRRHQDGGLPYWATSAARSLTDLADGGSRVDILLLGDCDLQMEADFLRREGAARGLDLRIAATFPDDIGLAGERAHDAIVVGALRGRDAIACGDAVPPFGPYVEQVRRTVEGLRALSAKPILIDNLPEPTVLPLGLADRGPDGHRNRFRRANLALAELGETCADVHVVDVAAALAAAGSARLVDDGLTSFTHFGSPGWMLQRPPGEKAAVHGLWPDPAPLSALVDGDPFGRERVVAAAHVDTLVTVLGLGAKKCVIVDLDGTLWPGVLAETGSPFAWDPETSGPHSYVGLFFGIQEALKTLKRRGIVLAAVSKNDESTIRDLWHYPAHYPAERLLTPDDFVTWRVNWTDKAENIRAIADELGFGLDRFVFVDDHPVERERVRQALPEVEVWGDDLFGLRRRLLSDPRLQSARMTAESGRRSGLVKAQLGRGRSQALAVDRAEFLASLAIRCTIERLHPEADLGRVRELFGRTTQFNTTGHQFTVAELGGILADRTGSIFTLAVTDRLGDYGLVGAAVVLDGDIAGFALSCRVMGLDVERRFLAAIIDALTGSHDQVTARIVQTARNCPVRNLYRDHGFCQAADGVWRLALGSPRDEAGASLALAG